MPSYHLQATAVANANSKNIISISNATGSGKIIRVYRVWIINSGTGTVSGGMTGFRIGRVNGVHSGGTGINFNPLSSCVVAGSATPFTGCSAATNATATIATDLRRVFKASDEIAATGATMDEIQNLLPWAVIWDSGYSDTNIEPFIIRENQCFTVQTDAAPSNAVGTWSVWAEVTIN